MQVLQQPHLQNTFQKSKIFCFDINISNFKFTSKQISVYGIDIKNKKN